MSKRAIKYIKPGSRKATTPNKEDPALSSKPDASLSQDQNLSFNKYDSKRTNKQSDIISENSSENTSSSDESDDSKPQQIPNGRHSESPTSKKPQQNEPQPLILVLSKSTKNAEPLKVDVSPPRRLERSVTSISDRGALGFDRQVSFVGKQRKSIFDPNMIRNLKKVKLETLKPDDQIEVKNPLEATAYP